MPYFSNREVRHQNMKNETAIPFNVLTKLGDRVSCSLLDSCGHHPRQRDAGDKFQRFGLISAGNSITVVFLFFFQSYGKVVYFITLFPYIVLTTFLIMGLQQVVCWFLYLSQFKFGLMLRFRRNNDNVSPVITDESITSKNNGSICSYHEWFWRFWQSGSLCNWDNRLLLDKEPQYQNRYLDLVVWYWDECGNPSRRDAEKVAQQAAV